MARAGEMETESLRRTLAPVVLESLRLPGLLREVCLHAGLPTATASGCGERFVFRSGPEPPGLLAALLAEALAADEAEVVVGPDGWGEGALPPGHLAVLPGFPG